MAQSAILNNAVVSIRLGVEDFHSGDAERTLSALRNISAGLLLLFKEKLLRLSPDGMLLHQNFELRWEAERVIFVPKGEQTVDFAGILDRFKKTGVSFDATGVKAILAHRNHIEHYKADVPIESLRETVSKAAAIIGSFCRDHLGEEAASMIGAETWQMMLEVQATYEAELLVCKTRSSTVAWPNDELKELFTDYLHCPECISVLVYPIDSTAEFRELEFCCASCGDVHDYLPVLEAALRIWAMGENYEAATNGGEYVNITCDSCGRETYLPESGLCGACDYSRFVRCPICDGAFPRSFNCEQCDHWADLADERNQ